MLEAGERAVAPPRDVGASPVPTPPGQHRKETLMMNRALAALVAVAVAGCTVGPDYVRPAVDAPTAWRIASATSMALCTRP